MHRQMRLVDEPTSSALSWNYLFPRPLKSSGQDSPAAIASYEQNVKMLSGSADRSLRSGAGILEMAGIRLFRQVFD
jgi:hypothetical protein